MKPYASAPRPNDGLLKGVALLQLSLALFTLVSERGSWPSVSMMVAGALLMIFCAREKINDERIEHLKLKAAKTGLLWGTLLVMLVRVVRVTMNGSRRGPGEMPLSEMPLSALDALGLVMLITLACYYYWRWQDGRAEPVS